MDDKVLNFQKDLIRNNVYCPESLMHPAKMHIKMCDWIIDKFTEPGETILDPMAVIGTTGIEAMLKGRNAILVEYEKYFCMLCEKNIMLVNQQKGLSERGSCIVINGDSRKLSELFDKTFPKSFVEKIVFSPPYGHESYITSDDVKRTDKWAKLVPKAVPYQVDKVAKTPPYQESQPVHDKEWYAKNKGKLSPAQKGVYSIDKIVFSPPFESSLAGSAKDDVEKFQHGSAGKGYSKDELDDRQIGNLKDKYYRWAMMLIYRECFKVLKEGGLMILVTKNPVEEGRQVPLDRQTIFICEENGFKLIDRYYRKLYTKSFWLNNYKLKWEKEHPNIPCSIAEYEDILVFLKPDAKQKELIDESKQIDKDINESNTFLNYKFLESD